MTANLITTEMSRKYAQDGVVFLRQALHPEWLMLIEQGLGRILSDSAQAKFKFYED